mmetsp:Transcript_104114/g.333856  ORF Transcript_104114/g.333856 Transcript_104114/m.333856 type:complete len:494 (-) Transcript_104114:2007-3488(-)
MLNRDLHRRPRSARDASAIREHANAAGRVHVVDEDDGVAARGDVLAGVRIHEGGDRDGVDFILDHTLLLEDRAIQQVPQGAGGIFDRCRRLRSNSVPFAVALAGNGLGLRLLKQRRPPEGPAVAPRHDPVPRQARCLRVRRGRRARGEPIRRVCIGGDQLFQETHHRSAALANLPPVFRSPAELLQSRVPKGPSPVGVVDLAAARQQLSGQDAQGRDGPRNLDIAITPWPRACRRTRPLPPHGLRTSLRRKRLHHGAIAQNLQEIARGRRVDKVHAGSRNRPVRQSGTLHIPGPLVVKPHAAAATAREGRPELAQLEVLQAPLARRTWLGLRRWALWEILGFPVILSRGQAICGSRCIGLLPLRQGRRPSRLSVGPEPVPLLARGPEARGGALPRGVGAHAEGHAIFEDSNGLLLGPRRGHELTLLLLRWPGKGLPQSPLNGRAENRRTIGREHDLLEDAAIAHRSGVGLQDLGRRSGRGPCASSALAASSLP